MLWKSEVFTLSHTRQLLADACSIYTVPQKAVTPVTRPNRFSPVAIRICQEEVAQVTREIIQYRHMTLFRNG